MNSDREFLRLIFRKKLEKQKVTTWPERFGKTLQQLSKNNFRFPEKKVAEDVKKAIVEVRAGVQNWSGS